MQLAVEREIICTAAVGVEVRPGLDHAIDEAAAHAIPSHAFLRRAWFAPAASERSTTLIARRIDGSIRAALPLVPIGRMGVGARMVPGSYWPFRSPPIAADATDEEMCAFLGEPAVDRALGHLWRMGPYYAGEPGASLIERAARARGWTVLKRELGTSFIMDIAALASEGRWPRPSATGRIRALERRLGDEGPIRFRFVRGDGWDTAALDALAAIEAASWVGKRTDGSGAKFLKPNQRRYWEEVLGDPTLAEMLSAAILFVGDTPAAFSFDLNAGHVQYAIAGSYDERFSRWGAGKIVTWRQLEENAARGIEIVDWGSGDSGYKRELGAVPGPEIVDCLFVRNRSAASILRPRWLRSSAETADGEEPPLLTRRQQLLVAAALTATAAASLSE